MSEIDFLLIRIADLLDTFPGPDQEPRADWMSEARGLLDEAEAEIRTLRDACNDLWRARDEDDLARDRLPERAAA